MELSLTPQPSKGELNFLKYNPSESLDITTSLIGRET